MLRLAPIGVLFTVPPAPGSWTRRRDADADAVLARALSLVSMVAEGFPVDEALPDVARFDLEAVLTRSGKGSAGAFSPDEIAKTWRATEDSNLWPTASEAAALSS